MDGKKFAKILTGIALIVFGFITRSIALESYSRNAEIFEWLGILMIVFGVVDVIVALAQKSENSNPTQSNNNHKETPMFMTCPYCGESNVVHNEKCYRCHRIINTHASTSSANQIPSDSWVCPKCKKINAKYVGTCGCGEVKPK